MIQKDNIRNCKKSDSNNTEITEGRIMSLWRSGRGMSYRGLMSKDQEYP